MAFGTLAVNGKQAVLFGLPGNPVAVMVTFYQFVRNALLTMSGASQTSPILLRAKSSSAIRKKPGRTEFQRGILSRHGTGDCEVSITGSQGSGVLRSMSEANCLIVLGHDQCDVNKGEFVNILSFEGLI